MEHLLRGVLGGWGEGNGWWERKDGEGAGGAGPAGPWSLWRERGAAEPSVRRSTPPPRGASHTTPVSLQKPLRLPSGNGGSAGGGRAQSARDSPRAPTWPPQGYTRGPPPTHRTRSLRPGSRGCRPSSSRLGGRLRARLASMQPLPSSSMRLGTVAASHAAWARQYSLSPLPASPVMSAPEDHARCTVSACLTSHPRLVFVYVCVCLACALRPSDMARFALMNGDSWVLTLLCLVHAPYPPLAPPVLFVPLWRPSSTQEHILGWWTVGGRWCILGEPVTLFLLLSRG